MRKKYSVVFLLLFILPYLSYSQSDTISKKSLKDIYPEADAVFKRKSKILHISDKEGIILSKYSVFERKVILKNEQTENYWPETIYYNSFEKLSDVNGVSRKPGASGKGKKAYVTDVQSTIESAELYNDIKKQDIWFSDAKEGNVITLQYTKDLTSPYLYHPFMFMSEEPSLRSTFSIKCDTNIDIGWKYHGSDEYEVTFVKKVNKKKAVYTWILDSVPSFIIEPNSPSYLESSPKIIYYIKSVTRKSGKKVVLDSVSALHKWYRKLTARPNYRPSQAIIDLTSKLVDTCKTEDEKIKAVFHWVQNNIKYISTPTGLGGFIPDDASIVFNNRYGDCKAMTNLTKEMLKEASIPSYYCWVGTQNLPYTYSENFTPSTDNHMILAIKKDGDIKLLDATSSYGELYKTPYYIQGKETLISFGDSNFVVFKIPFENYKDNTVIDSNYLYEEDGMLHAHASIKLNGSLKHKIEAGFPIIHDEVIEFISDHFLTANKKTKIDHVSYSGIQDRSNSMEIKYDYHLFDHEVNTADKKYINLNLDKPLVDFKIDIEDRKTDYIFDFPRTDYFIVVYEIPEGYKLSYLPDDVHIDFEGFAAEVTYKESNGTVELRRQIGLKNLRVKTEDFKNWNEFISTLKNVYSHVIVLEKI